jgi:hypothetical protein
LCINTPHSIGKKLKHGEQFAINKSQLNKEEETALNRKLLKRRAEMLDMTCKGFHPSAVISQLSEKYNLSEKSLWSDWDRRTKWVPILLDLEKYSDFAKYIESKINAVQKGAWSIYHRGDSDNARVGALKVVLSSLEVLSNTVLSKEILLRLEHVEELAKKNATENEKI